MRALGRSVATVVVLGAVSACGGGGGPQSMPPPAVAPTPSPAPAPAPTPAPSPAPTPSSFTLSGQVTVPPDTVIDIDTADVTSSNGNNDDLATAQVLPNPVTLGGHADIAQDEFDIYAMPLARGQRIDLAVAEDGLENDLDLILADRNGNIVASSESTSNTESITVPSAGDFLVAVQAFDGSSNYVLTVRQGSQQAAASAHGQRTQSPVIPGDLLVRFADGALTVPLRQRLAAAGLVPSTVVSDTLQVWSLGPDMFWPSTLANLGVVDRKPLGPYADVTARARHDTLRAMKQVSRWPGVVRVEPNFSVQAARVPSDTGFADQWHYRLINLPQAWDVTIGSNNVVVAVIDTGVALGHPDLAGQFDPSDTSGFDFISSPSIALDGDGRDSNADDPGDDAAGGGSFHGTHVAGTVAAASDNGMGVAGVAWNSRIMPLRVLGRGGGSSADILAAVRYAAGLNVGGVQAPRAAQIINLSLGCDDCFSSSEAEVYREAVNRGLMIAAAAGNSGDAGNPIGFPASYDGVVSVAAVGPSVSSAAPRRASYSQFNRFVDVTAPGGDGSRAPARQSRVLSTHAEGFGGQRRATYGLLEGTSMASPHVAGVMALMKAVFPALTPTQFDQLLAAGDLTTDLAPAGRDDENGFGLIDAAKAVQAATRLASGGSVPDRPALVVQPEQLDFGRSTGTASLEARNGGTGNLSITNVSDDAPWLTVSAGTAQNNRLPLTASVNRSGLADGSYSATITVQSSANTVRVPVLMQVGGLNAAATAGVHFFLLLNAETYEALDQVRVLPSNGRYNVQFDAVPPGEYIVLGGTDSDQDDLLCDAGEACAIYTTPDLPTPVSVSNANVSNLNFSTGFDFSVFAQSASSAPGKPLRPGALHWLPAEGLRLKHSAKGVQ